MKKIKVLGFKLGNIAILFSLLFAFLPTSAQATTSTPYIENNHVYLTDYDGDSLDLPDYTGFMLFVHYSGDNHIITTGEYGIRGSAKYLLFIPENTDSTLDITVSSTTSVANGIINPSGSIEIESGSHITIHVSSALPQESISTSEVTGITAMQSIITFPDSTLAIYNPTGSYAIFAKNYSISGVAETDFLHVTHKITDGVGDAFYANDFEDVVYRCISDTDCSRHVITSMPEFTFSHYRTDTLGEFRFITSIFDGVATTLDTSPISTDALAAPELRSAEEARLRASLSIPDAYAQLPFAIDYDKSRLVEEDGKYYFRIEFYSTNPDYGFLHQHQGPFSFLSLNGTTFVPEDANRLRPDDGYHESFDILLDTYTPAPVIDEPTPDEPVPDDPTPPAPVTPEDTLPEITIITTPVIPKTPDTSIPAPATQYNTAVVIFPCTLFLIVYTIFVIKLTHG